MTTNRLFPTSPEPLVKGEPVREIKVADLLLDPENPRLELPPNATQERILGVLYRDHRLEELMSSFIANSYFHEEPLVAIPSGKQGKFVVVEGNRRLAALKLLLDSGLASKVKATTVPEHSEAQLRNLAAVPVKVYSDRGQVLPYLGFRHITGVKEWDAASKARYVFQLKHTTTYSLDEISNMIGDTYNMTERLYLGWSLLQQAKDTLGIDQDDFVKFPFSYMYDAVRTPEVKQFLGLKPDAYKVSKSHHDELKELLKWLFGSKSHDTEPLVEKKEQLKMLAAVVVEKRATAAIRSGATLDEAFHSTVGEESLIIEWLTRAGRDLDKSKGIIHRHKKSRDVQDLVERCAETIRRIEKEVRL